MKDGIQTPVATTFTSFVNWTKKNLLSLKDLKIVAIDITNYRVSE